MNGIKPWFGLAALAAGLLLSGCGTAQVTLPRKNRMTPPQAVGVIERSARLNAVTAARELESAAPAWADEAGWYAVEEGRIVKLYYADIEAVYRTYAAGADVAASACVAGLMGPFSAACVEVRMKDGKAWRLQADPGGDPAVCLNCAPLWLVTFPRPVNKTRLIGRAFEFMRVRAGIP
jgi:hypothetical protein